MRTGPPGLTECTHCLRHWPIATIYARDCLDYTRPCSWLCFERDVNPMLNDPMHPTLSSSHTQSMILGHLCLIQYNMVMVPFSGLSKFQILIIFKGSLKTDKSFIISVTARNQKKKLKPVPFHHTLNLLKVCHRDQWANRRLRGNTVPRRIPAGQESSSGIRRESRTNASFFLSVEEAWNNPISKNSDRFRRPFTFQRQYLFTLIWNYNYKLT